MKDIRTFEFNVDPHRDTAAFLAFSTLVERLGWTHYPTNVTGEDIDNGDDSDTARSETIEYPGKDYDLFYLLYISGVFDNL